MIRVMRRFARIMLVAFVATIVAACGRAMSSTSVAVSSAPRETARPSSSKADGESPLEVSGWVVAWDTNSLASLAAHADSIARVYAEFITCGEDGLPRLNPAVPPGWIERVRDLSSAHKVHFLLMMNNFADGSFEPDRVRRFLHDTALMERHIAETVRIAKEERADGLDVDYEGLDAPDRAAFTDFVAALGARCRAEKLLLGVAVHPKESEPGSWGGPAAQDYAALGAAADFVHVMAYDFHWATSDSGSIAPPDWVERVMTFAASRISAEKLELGLNAYGYDWSGRSARTVTAASWTALVAEQALQGRSPHRDSATLEMRLAHDGREAWFPDAVAYGPKLAVARRLMLRGVALWALGQEDPGFWRR